MSGIIETIARAMRAYVSAQPDKVRALSAGTFVANRDVFLAEAAVQALTEAGYAIVPIEPTDAMLEAGMDFDERHIEISLGRPPTVEECQAGEWRAMIEAWRPK